jgi:hypothetical protein
MTTYTERFTHAVAVLCGAQPPTDMVAEWIANVDVNGEHRLQSWVLSQAATPSWAQGIVVLDAAHVLANDPEEGMEHEDRPPAAQPAVQEPVAQDAEQWGRRLNDASWAATKAWNTDLMGGPMPAAVFNNIKGLIRTAILSYLEGYTAAPAAQPAAQSCYCPNCEALAKELAALKAQPAVPEGWKLVPVRLTQNMAEAAKAVDGRLSVWKYDEAYQAMLAAAPEKGGAA